MKLKLSHIERFDRLEVGANVGRILIHLRPGVTFDCDSHMGQFIFKNGTEANKAEVYPCRCQFCMGRPDQI